MCNLPRLAALAGWLASSAVARRLARAVQVPPHGVPVICTGDWCLVAAERGPADLYADHDGAFTDMDRVSHVARLGPVVVAWHDWQDGSPSVHVLRTARELTGADREVALARHRRAHEVPITEDA